MWSFSFAGYALPLMMLLGQAQLSDKTVRVERKDICVTEGSVTAMGDGRLQTQSEKMRAFVNLTKPQSIETHFTYMGPTGEISQLGSGALRLQFGLDLRYQDPCNVIYAMWRVEPESKLVVSVKRNMGMTKSSQCSNSGYTNIKPIRSTAVPRLRNGDSHTFSAAMKGDELRVFVDQTEVWTGAVGPEGADLNGPVGMRTDNVKLVFDMNAGGLAGAHSETLRPCTAAANSR
ncbi:hypothetical protein ACFPT7_11695 [Acidicapsa dinghuensis]|uniref:LamG domain-containing protein n=1 Tax=Acidicapsa dinghuensis TaxID=2218256 RepID=A0ABW1EHW6_9BACT|nr:hypothetical protein [Acidicapsa dinghuensis]